MTCDVTHRRGSWTGDERSWVVIAAQSMNCLLDGEATDGSGAPRPEDDEEQIDFGSE